MWKTSFAGGIDMHKVEFKCEVITPMFMAGADRNSVEPRPSEFKGMMRFWWRTMKAENNIEKLKKEEAEIFGGTGIGEGRSKIRIRLIYDLNTLKNYTGQNLKDDYNFHWIFDRQNNTLSGSHAGIGYLLYSTVLPGRHRAYIKHGFPFHITISSFDKEAYGYALASLWLSIYLGGFGTRARRGCGCIVVNQVEGETFGINFIPKGKDLETWIKENLNAIKSITGETKDFCYAYSNLSFARMILSKKSFNTWYEALNEIGVVYKKFRENYRNKIFELGSFGLPVLHRNNKKLIATNDTTRRASPLIFKIIRFNEKYYWMVLRLSGEFLPDGVVLKFENKTSKPDYSLVDLFWKELKNTGKEIILCKPQKLIKIIEQLKEKGAKKIILFGSKARGDFHKKSDIDIAIEGNVSDLEIIENLDIVKLEVANNRLREKINREGVILYDRET
ncbi:MAG: CRISPR-associated protein Cmr1 [Thermoanaerobacterium sp.]|nr:CRISPR-associated protein Cmr1 [Thermoanaerobacterium sp.]MDK2811977.1 CRISPR-associated protein Cmr1 [Petrotoga sp.]